MARCFTLESMAMESGLISTVCGSLPYLAQSYATEDKHGISVSLNFCCGPKKDRLFVEVLSSGEEFNLRIRRGCVPAS